MELTILVTNFEMTYGKPTLICLVRYETTGLKQVSAPPTGYNSLISVLNDDGKDVAFIQVGRYLQTFISVEFVD